MRPGMELAQEKDFSVTLTREDFAKNSKPLPTSSDLRAGRKNPRSMDGTKLRRRNLGELRWTATVSRRLGARLARIDSWPDALRGLDTYRINELVRVVKEWQRAASAKYASPSRPWKTLRSGGAAGVDLRNRGEKVLNVLGWMGGCCF